MVAMPVADSCAALSLLFAMPGVNPDSSAALYPPPFSRPDETNGAAAVSASSAPVAGATSTAPSDSQPAPFSASTIASLFPSMHRSTSLSANPPALTTSTTATTIPSSTLSPFLSRQLSTSRPSTSAATAGEWRTSVTVEDRLQQRAKIRDAYQRQCGGSLAVLLEMVQAVEEELLFSCSGSRLDYFKAAIDYDARLRIKKQQLAINTTTGAAGGAGAAAGSGSSGENGTVKRERHDSEQQEKEAGDKKVDDEESPEEEDEEGEEASDRREAAEPGSEPTNKKQKN